MPKQGVVTARVHTGSKQFKEFTVALCDQKWSMEMKVFKICVRPTTVHDDEKRVLRTVQAIFLE